MFIEQGFPSSPLTHKQQQKSHKKVRLIWSHWTVQNKIRYFQDNGYVAVLKSLQYRQEQKVRGLWNGYSLESKSDKLFERDNHVDDWFEKYFRELCEIKEKFCEIDISGFLWKYNKWERITPGKKKFLKFVCERKCI